MERQHRHMLMAGMVVQITPEYEERCYATCFVVIREVKPFGVLGYVQSIGIDGNIGGVADVKLKWDDFELVGHAIWVDGAVAVRGREHE